MSYCAVKRCDEIRPSLKVIEHHAACQQHGRGVGNVPVGNTLPSVPRGLTERDETNRPDRERERDQRRAHLTKVHLATSTHLMCREKVVCVSQHFFSL